MKLKTLFFFYCMLIGASAYADGLATDFVDEIVYDVPAGQKYFVRGATGGGMVVRNLSDSPLPVRVQAIQPASAKLKEGAVIIPDVHWVILEPSEFVLPPRGEGTVHIALQVPNSRTYKGKKYQVMIFTKSNPKNKAGLTLAANILSRLIFTTHK